MKRSNPSQVKVAGWNPQADRPGEDRVARAGQAEVLEEADAEWAARSQPRRSSL